MSKKNIILSAALAIGSFVGFMMAPAQAHAEPPVSGGDLCLHIPESPTNIRWYSDSGFTNQVGFYAEYCCVGETFTNGSTSARYKKVWHFESCPSEGSPYTLTCYDYSTVIPCP